MSVVVMQNRGLPGWPPRPPTGGNEQKAALIKENQMGPKSLRLFLYAATGSASNAQWPWGRVGSPGVRAPGRTSRRGATVARRGWDDRQPRTLCGSRSGFVSASIDRWGSRMPRRLPEAEPGVGNIPRGAVCAGDLEPAWPSERPRLLRPRSAAIERQRKMRRGGVGRPLSKPGHAPAMQWHVGDAVPMLSAIQWVSFTIYRHSVCITFAKGYNHSVLLLPISAARLQPDGSLRRPHGGRQRNYGRRWLHYCRCGSSFGRRRGGVYQGGEPNYPKLYLHP